VASGYRGIIVLPMRKLFVICIAANAIAGQSAAQWTITPRNAMTINTAAVPGVAELSGIAYEGPLGGTSHRFLAVQDSGGQLVSLSLAVASDGSMTSAAASSSQSLSPSYDFEGVAFGFSGNILIAEESTPQIRAYDETSGAATAALTMPAVFSDDRSNFAFESITRAADGLTFWTANEGALIPDGPLANTTHGTTVRLQKFHYVKPGTLTLGPQFAYEVDPIHVGTTTDSNTRSGLSDLVALPDGSLLVLERSLGITAVIFGVPIYQYQSQIYRVTFDGATDTSLPPFSSGLSGQSYTPATKTLLWTGLAGGNLEGLTLGPVLPNGAWSLIGVVDNSGGGDPFSGNTVVAFTLTPPRLGDFNFDGQVDAADFVVFRKGLSGNVSSHYGLWTKYFGESTTGAGQTTPLPEPSSGALIVAASVVLSLFARNR
jgi:hypothetical protein